LYAVSPGGHLKWFLPVPGDAEPDSTPCIGQDGTIYVGSASPYVYAVNPDGSLKWVFDVIPGSLDYPAVIFSSSPAIDSSGTIRIGSTEFLYDSIIGALFAINPDGTTNSVFDDSSSPITSSPAIAGDGTVYFESVFYTIYALTNNSPAWTYTADGGNYSSPAIGTDGTVYMASGDGYLYAFFGSAPLATNAAWPMFHQNPTHSGLQSPPRTTAEDCGAPFVSDGTNDGAGNFTFNIVAGTSNHWNVFASTNLTNWTQVSTNVAFAQSVDSYNWNASYKDTSVTGVSQRFYQLVNTNSTCSSRVIGFVNLNIVSGTNLIADQLDQVDNGALANSSNYGYFPVNTLNALFPPGLYGISEPFTQLGTEIMKWNGRGFEAFTFEYVTFYGDVWSDVNGLFNGDATMLPGIGVLMNNGTGSPFTCAFVGLVREQQIFQIPASTNSQPTTNYLSATVPMAGVITNVTGYVPHNGDIIQLWKANTQVFTNYSYMSNNWSPSNPPPIGVGEGFVLVTTNAHTWTNTWPP
jgi:outer membrane protein assembly factor BamB